MDWILKACDEVCGKKKGEELQEIQWWWWWLNDRVRKADSRKKDAHEAMCPNSTVEVYKNVK